MPKDTYTNEWGYVVTPPEYPPTSGETALTYLIVMLLVLILAIGLTVANRHYKAPRTKKEQDDEDDDMRIW